MPFCNRNLLRVSASLLAMILLVCVQACNMGPPPPSPGWPGIYGPYQDSRSDESNVVAEWDESGPKQKWSREIGTGYSTPISAGDQTFVLFRKGDEEILECLNTETGTLTWDFRRPTTFVCGWEGYSSGPYSTPVLDDQNLYFVSAQGTMHCLKRQDGEPVWSRNLFSQFELQDQKWPVVASPALWQDRLIFNLGASKKSAGIIAVDIRDGSILWQATDDPASHTTPLIKAFHGKQLAFVLTAEGLVCLKPENGEVVWEIPHQMRVADDMFGNAVSPIAFDDKIVMVSGPHVRPGFRCFRIKSDLSYDEPWSDVRLLNTQYTNLICSDGFLYGMKGAGSEMRCIDMEKGELVWKANLQTGRANGIAVNDSILLFGERGQLASIEINPEELVVKSMTSSPVLEAPCFTPMALNRGLLFLRNDQQLVCLNLRKYEPKIETATAGIGN